MWNVILFSFIVRINPRITFSMSNFNYQKIIFGIGLPITYTVQYIIYYNVYVYVLLCICICIIMYMYYYVYVLLCICICILYNPPKPDQEKRLRSPKDIKIYCKWSSFFLLFSHTQRSSTRDTLGRLLY